MDETERTLIQKEFAHLDTLYFNSAYFGPSPYRAKQKVANALYKELDPSFFPYNTWMGFPDRSRSMLAELISTSPDNITHSTSTSDIQNVLALGFPFKAEDIVCAVDGDYPSNVLPWMLAQKRGRAQFQLLPKTLLPDVAFLQKHLPANCRIFTTSLVGFDTGRKIDLLKIGKFLKERGIFFVVDATQALGGMGISAQELALVDVLACSSYKWMLGPYGHAWAYFSNEAIKLVEYQHANWVKSPNSKDAGDLVHYTIETLPGARKFDRGEPSNMLANACLEASIEFLKQVGLNNIEKHNAKVRDFFLDNFPKKKYQVVTPKEGMSNIVALKSLDGLESQRLERELKHHNIDVSVRQGNIRLSFHIFNREDQVETLIRALDI